MSAAPVYLLPVDYDRLYAAKPGWEYVRGQAVRKPAPTWLHGILQRILSDLLSEAGYFAAPEVEMRAVPDWWPRPDVSGVLELTGEPYPLYPVDVALEVLSENQSLEEKCQDYAAIGVQQIFVFDPKERTINAWNHREQRLESVLDIHLANGSIIRAGTIWRKLDEALQRRASGPVVI